MNVIDRNGIAIEGGQTVLVHQDDVTREALVVEPFPNTPTVNAPGHWVDVNIGGRGVEGMMSYILEVLTPKGIQCPAHQ